MAEANPKELDLGACAREPIHIPGAIQPHGTLLALDRQHRIVRAAGDLHGLLGWQGDPFGSPVEALIDLSDIDLSQPGPCAEYAGTVTAAGKALDLFLHQAGEELIVELEPAPPVRLTGAEVLRDLLEIVTGLAGADEIDAASRIAAEGVRRITGYDRIMIYRFLDDDTGQVIAEARADDVESFLNHRYPASDIPKQARALYLRNPIRLIPDVDYRPASVTGGDGPLDLSGALLRSVSPVHIQYLKNMEVGASASVSLVQHQGLWGLIACHHRKARPIPHEQREMCRRIGIALDQAIARLEEEDHQREALRLTRRREELLPVLAAADSLGEGLRRDVDELRRLVAADGIGVLIDDDMVVAGVTPPREAAQALARWLLNEAPGERFGTDSLSSLYEPAADWSASASGLLACIVSRSPRIAILWFRAEQVETVNWAGNPHKPAEPGSVPGKLTPRKSFDLWCETVRGRSRPWRANEQEAARRIASGLAEIGRQKALAELNRQLTGQVAEQDLLMREVHHRVQNSLQLVTSMLQLQERELAEEGARDQLALARDRVLSVAMLHRRLWRSEDLEHINLETFFAELIEGLVLTWPGAWKDKVTLDIAPLRLPAHEALLIALIVSELLTNAVKHAYGGDAGPLALTAGTNGKDRVTITVADRGVGTTGEDRPGSFGSRLVQRLVAKMGGELAVRPNDPGTAVTLTVPIALQ